MQTHGEQFMVRVPTQCCPAFGQKSRSMMTTHKDTIRQAAFSERSARVDKSPPVAGASSGTQIKQREHRFLDRTQPEGRPTAMARCVERHRRLLAAVARFSQSRAKAGGWNRRAAVACLGLSISWILERLARRRLFGRKPIDRREAEQKILYLIAAMLAQRMELRAKEIAMITASVREFHMDLNDLLRINSS